VLFALLEGRIEPVKRVDGIERVLGERHRGRSSVRCRSCWGRCSLSAFARQRTPA
jgi:hypothetical protein